MIERLRIGVDVGGTNTDAALLRGNEVLATIKTATTENVTDGVSVRSARCFRLQASPVIRSVP